MNFVAGKQFLNAKQFTNIFIFRKSYFNRTENRTQTLQRNLFNVAFFKVRILNLTKKMLAPTSLWYLCYIDIFQKIVFLTVQGVFPSADMRELPKTNQQQIWLLFLSFSITKVCWLFMTAINWWQVFTSKTILLYLVKLKNKKYQNVICD